MPQYMASGPYAFGHNEANHVAHSILVHATPHADAGSYLLELRCSNIPCSYRGYGRSQGQPCEAGIKLDAQAALDHLLERKDVTTDLVSSIGMGSLTVMRPYLQVEELMIICKLQDPKHHTVGLIWLYTICF